MASMVYTANIRPRPRSSEVCGHIALAFGSGNITANFLWPRSQVVYLLYTPTSHGLYTTQVPSVLCGWQVWLPFGDILSGIWCLLFPGSRLSRWLKFGHCAEVQIFASCMWAYESVQNKVDIYLHTKSILEDFSQGATNSLSVNAGACTPCCTKGHTKFSLLSLWPSSQWTLLRCSMGRYFIQSVDTEWNLAYWIRRSPCTHASKHAGLETALTCFGLKFGIVACGYVNFFLYVNESELASFAPTPAGAMADCEWLIYVWLE